MPGPRLVQDKGRCSPGHVLEARPACTALLDPRPQIADLPACTPRFRDGSAMPRAQGRLRGTRFHVLRARLCLRHARHLLEETVFKGQADTREVGTGPRRGQGADWHPRPPNPRRDADFAGREGRLRVGTWPGRLRWPRHRGRSAVTTVASLCRALPARGGGSNGTGWKDQPPGTRDPCRERCCAARVTRGPIGGRADLTCARWQLLARHGGDASKCRGPHRSQRRPPHLQPLL